MQGNILIRNSVCIDCSSADICSEAVLTEVLLGIKTVGHVFEFRFCGVDPVSADRACPIVFFVLCFALCSWVQSSGKNKFGIYITDSFGSIIAPFLTKSPPPVSLIFSQSLGKSAFKFSRSCFAQNSF